MIHLRYIQLILLIKPESMICGIDLYFLNLLWCFDHTDFHRLSSLFFVIACLLKISSQKYDLSLQNQVSASMTTMNVLPPEIPYFILYLLSPYCQVKVKLLSHVQLFATPWTVAYQAPPSRGFSRQEYWSGLPFPSPEDLPDPGIEPRSPALEADALTSEPAGKPSGSSKKQ